jgi:tetratricopeptide (TPR) repeat protein
MEKLFDRIIYYFLFTIIFIFPFFFLPVTQEFFLTNKLYLLAFSSLFLLLISTIKIAITKKISWQKGAFDNLLVLFLLSLAISIIISSSNKVQALLNPNFGFLTFFSLTILYFYLSRFSLNLHQSPSISTNLHKSQFISTYLHLSLSISSFLLSLFTIIFFFQPFKNVNLPQSLSFLKSPSFTPIGSQLDLAIFLGFFLIYGLTRTFGKTHTNTDNKRINTDNPWTSVFSYLWLSVILIALSLTLYSLLKPISTNLNQSPSTSNLLPPFRLSWYAAVEILKNPKTAFFGVGVDNFASIFTRVKDIAYNQSNLWQVFSFNFSRSAILHLFTETGFLGLLVFSLLIFSVLKQLIATNLHQSPSISINLHKSLLISFIYLLICLFFFPPSLITWFLLFVVIGLEGAKMSVSNDLGGAHFDFTSEEHAHGVRNTASSDFDLSLLLPLYLGIVLFSFIFLTGFGYLLGRSYLAEIYFKKALDGIVKNDAKQAYENMRQAIILNPYIERFRLNFSQLNLLLANNIAAKAGQPQEKDKKPSQLSEQDRQNISQAIQAAIAEGKAAISLNPQKAQNWENLAQIYRNIINTAQGAGVWTVSSYQRAIVADPQNPVYRLNLGGVYYSLGNFEEASKIFEQAVVLKPDWPNAYYNLAWANFQKQKYQEAVSAMENVIRLLDPKKDKNDYEKARKELEEFKKKLPQEEKQATEEGKTQPKLTLPSPIPTTTPQIQLPKEASP